MTSKPPALEAPSFTRAGHEANIRGAPWPKNLKEPKGSGEVRFHINEPSKGCGCKYTLSEGQLISQFCAKHGELGWKEVIDRFDEYIKLKMAMGGFTLRSPDFVDDEGRFWNIIGDVSDATFLIPWDDL